MPIFGVMRLTFESEGGSINGDDDFFSVARTMPFVAAKRLDFYANEMNRTISNSPLMPSAVTPWLTAFKAYSSL